MRYFLFCLLLSCGSPTNPVSVAGTGESYSLGNNCHVPAFPIIISPNYTEYDEENQEVVDTWNEEMGENLFEIGEGGVRVSFSRRLDLDLDALTMWTCSDGVKIYSEIQINSNHGLDSKTYESILAHEFGHVLGMDHTSYGIMQAVSPVGDLANDIGLMQDYFNELY